MLPSFGDLKKAIDNYKGEIKKLVILLSDIGGIINPDIEKMLIFLKEKKLIYFKNGLIILD